MLFFNQQKTFTTLRLYLKNNHIEKIIDLKSAIEYVKKEGDFIEFGDIPSSQGKRNDIHDFKNAIIEGSDDLELLDEFPAQYFQFHNVIDKVRQKQLSHKYSQVNRELKVMYISGVPGSGKTYSIYKHFKAKDIHRVTNYKNAFDNYLFQNVLVLDEYRNNFHISLLLNLLDVYPLLLPARYLDKWASYEYVFVISNLTFNENFNSLDKQSYNALLRRFDDIYHMSGDYDRDELSKRIEKLQLGLDLPF